MRHSDLAIFGGEKVRTAPMPYRRLFAEEELKAVEAVFKESWENRQDFGYNGNNEKKYMETFCEFQGGGYADAVCSGTMAVFIALLSLGLKPGSDVVVSPVTDPGGVSPVIMAGMNPVLSDSAPGSFNIGPHEFEAALTPGTAAAIITHVAGIPVDMPSILAIAEKRNVLIIEDCSQAHGAAWDGINVGNFGHVSAFSTMFSKTHASGGCGGIVFTRDQDRYHGILALADRGKPFYGRDFDPKDPDTFLFPALNVNQDEISCAIGRSTLEKLPRTLVERNRIKDKLDEALAASSLVSPPPKNPRVVCSPFFYTAEVALEKLRVSKREFARAVEAEGIPLNPDYRYVVPEWDWMKPYLGDPSKEWNAAAYRDKTFNILFNERYGDREISDIIQAIIKVEKVMGC